MNAEERPTPDDERACELLDQYTGACAAGDERAQQSLAGDHPELSRLFRCLHTLDQLAPIQLAGGSDFT
jgi:hypothetical protein